jgi:hypothetical protein
MAPNLPMDCNYLQSFVGLSRHGCCIEEIKFAVARSWFMPRSVNSDLTPCAYTSPFVLVGTSTLNEVRVALLRRDSEPKQQARLIAEDIWI